LEFLPPYSPDFNPIEATFHDLKAWIQRNYQQADDFAAFGGFLEYAVNQNNGQNARAHYKHAGYVVED
jgi:transposase